MGCSGKVPGGAKVNHRIVYTLYDPSSTGPWTCWLNPLFPEPSRISLPLARANQAAGLYKPFPVIFGRSMAATIPASCSTTTGMAFTIAVAVWMTPATA
jgi:hypothetical protein